MYNPVTLIRFMTSILQPHTLSRVNTLSTNIIKLGIVDVGDYAKARSFLLTPNQLTLLSSSVFMAVNTLSNSSMSHNLMHGCVTHVTQTIQQTKLKPAVCNLYSYYRVLLFSFTPLFTNSLFFVCIYSKYRP